LINQNPNLDTLPTTTALLIHRHLTLPDPLLASATTTAMAFSFSDSDTQMHRSLTKKEAFNWNGPPPVSA
jgi:hypothetical protein